MLSVLPLLLTGTRDVSKLKKDAKEQKNGKGRVDRGKGVQGRAWMRRRNHADSCCCLCPCLVSTFLPPPFLFPHDGVSASLYRQPRCCRCSSPHAHTIDGDSARTNTYIGASNES